MVLQMPCPDQQFVFVASSLEDRQQAEREIANWASSHGYRLPTPDQIFTLYSGALRSREWRLLECPPVHRPSWQESAPTMSE